MLKMHEYTRYLQAFCLDTTMKQYSQFCILLPSLNIRRYIMHLQLMSKLQL